jgi:enoyl-CoA hydratase
MSFENFLLERDGAVAVLLIKRLHVLNALNSSTIGRLKHSVADLTHDASERSVITRKTNVTG